MTVFVRIVATVGTAVALLAGSSGISSAWDPLIGSTYADASKTISGWGSKPLIETVFGSKLATDDCIVSRWQKSNARKAILIDLNCNATVAAAGTPGNSAASPEGRTAKKNLATAAWCSLPEQATYAPCAKFCNLNADLCTVTF